MLSLLGAALGFGTSIIPSILDLFQQKQKDTLKKHSVHHSAKHMTMMRKLMKGGETFTASHKKTQKKIGK